MWGGSVSSQKDYAYFQSSNGIPRVEETKDSTNTDKDAVLKLLKELEDAQKTSKSQAVQDLRNKLNDLREKLGEDKFKEIIENLKKDAPYSWLEFLKALFPELFPDDVSTGADESQLGGSGGGGGGSGRYQGGGLGGGINAGGTLGLGERVGNLPVTAGTNQTNFEPGSYKPGEMPSNLFSGAYQGQEGNCGAISACKAMIAQFGPAGVFKDIKRDASGNYDVTLKNGNHVQVTQAQYRESAARAQLQGQDPKLLGFMNLMLAVNNVQAMRQRNDGISGSSFSEAINSINDGEWAVETFNRLGYGNLIERVSPSQLAAGRVGTLDNNTHSLAVLNRSEDRWGTRYGNVRTDPNLIAWGFKREYA
ncbi:hypothetical protein PspCFBP13528_26485 [Pseudomonas sp. CFBP13528]|uniref:hypothetical protein n=1 Tax=Pseudomonas sp. CFBP13528 TaxID=2184006 RepID=UPI0010C10159|nr:hypothetical protein [Pseudomonas sp. CFBP13528]TKK25514.1 hypothetical protein PspCFBP13528_26485 [Pseudomonas sp. CFBP13528]